MDNAQSHDQGDIEIGDNSIIHNYAILDTQGGKIKLGSRCSEGEIGLCEHDFYFSEIMGDVKKQSLIDIWNSEKYFKVRKNLIKGNRRVSLLCAKCDYSGFRRISNPHEKYHGVLSSPDRKIKEWFLEKINLFAHNWL